MFLVGASLNNLGENLNFKKEEFVFDFKQAVVAYTMDTFLEKYPLLFPTHLKIDVDGIERKIINGATNTLKDPRLKQNIIELNTNLKDDLEIIEILKAAGFEQMSKQNAANALTEYDSLYNYLFIKK